MRAVYELQISSVPDDVTFTDEESRAIAVARAMETRDMFKQYGHCALIHHPKSVAVIVAALDWFIERAVTEAFKAEAGKAEVAK